MNAPFSYDFTFWQWVALVVSAFFVGLSKTGISGALTVMVPVLARIVGAKESTGLFLPMLCFADIIAVLYYHRSAEWKYILRLLPWALTGFACAIFADHLVPAQHFKTLIGLCMLGGLTVMFCNDMKAWRLRHSNQPEKKAGKAGAWRRVAVPALFGSAGGFSTLIGNTAGPLMSVFLLSMRLPKSSFVGTAAWFFLIVNYLKVPVQVLLWHNITLAGLSIDLLLIPCIILGALSGIALVKKISERYYRVLIYIMTLLSTLLLFL